MLVFDLPFNLNLRYTFMQGAKVTPYVWAGVSTHLAGGDYVESVEPGFVGALGIEFFRTSPVGMGIEAGFDTATLEIDDLTAGNAGETADIQPLGFVIRVFVVF